MSEWWTYDLSNLLLFSPRTYDRLIESYNLAVWPAQIVALLSGIAILFLSMRRDWERARLAGTVLLATAWLWVALAFHLERYAPINWSAKWFAAAFVLQAVLLVITDLVPRKAPKRATPAAFRVSGSSLALAAILVLPLAQWLLGRTWPQVEVFALLPDATAIATLGVLLVRDRFDWHLYPIPIIWCGIGSATLHAMHRPDAPVVIAATVLGIVLTVWKAASTRRLHPRWHLLAWSFVSRNDQTATGWEQAEGGTRAIEPNEE